MSFAGGYTDVHPLTGFSTQIRIVATGTRKPAVYWCAGPSSHKASTKQEISKEPMADKLTTYTDGNWDKEVLGSDTPVLVDFWAEWCVPCKTLVPTIEAVAEQFGARLKVGKLNVEENAHVPYRYNITTLPTLMIFKRGQVSEQRVGLLSKENLIKLVEPHLG